MRPAILLFLALATLACVVGCGDDNTVTDAVSEVHVEYLFTQEAEGGSLIQSPDGSYILTLDGVDNRTVAFADRPVRDAHVVQTPDIAFDFVELFGEDPPNAALSYEPAGGGPTETAVFVISDPDYNSSTDTLTYKAEDIPVDEGGLETVRKGKSLDQVPALFGPASLFIDPATVNSQITDFTVTTPTDTATVSMEATWTLTAKAVSSTGTPLQNVDVFVTVFPSNSTYSSTTGPDGTATITGLGSPEQATLQWTFNPSGGTFWHNMFVLDWEENLDSDHMSVQFTVDQSESM